jgi:pimeloyl-ACP methyl ester carboxylesterase
MNLLAIPVLLWSLAVGGLWSQQERLLFFPEPIPAEMDLQTSDIREEWVEVPGARLHALHLRQPSRDGRPTTRGIVFYLHGNAGNVKGWLNNADYWRRSGFDLFMLDYRGFGKSTGQIEHEAQLLDDVQRAWAQVAPEYQGLRRVVLGRSLGTGLATYLASKVQPDLLVLVSPYRSIAAMAQSRYPWVPGFALRYPLRTEAWLPEVRSQILICHGDRDPLIPISHAEALHDLAPGSRLVRIPGAAHDDIQLNPVYQATLMSQLQSL